MILLLLLFSMMCGAVIQALLPTWGWLGQTYVPVLLSLVLYYALTHDDVLMLAAGMLAGLLQDALALIPLGYSSFCFCVVALVVSRYREMVFVGQWVTHMLLGAVAAGGVSLVLSILLASNDLLTISWIRALWKAVGAVLLGAVAAPLVFHTMENLDRKLGNIAREDT